MSLKLAANARAAREAFKEEVAQPLADTRWFEADGDIVDGICDRARYADLVILGQYERQGPRGVASRTRRLALWPPGTCRACSRWTNFVR